MYRNRGNNINVHYRINSIQINDRAVNYYHTVSNFKITPKFPKYRENQNNFLVTPSVISRKSLQNVMRIFWVSQDKENCIMEKNGP